MKRILLPLFAIAMLLVSCDETVTFDDTRKIDNETQFAKIAANPDYKKIESKSGNGFIMYKVLKEGESNQKPYFTDKVKVLYTGWYRRFWTKDDTFTDDNGNKFQNKVIFDTTSESNIPRTMRIDDPNYPLIDGFSTALQNMNVGDKWEVWIPWNMGYGASGNNTIVGYSTLVFEIELLEIIGRK